MSSKALPATLLLLTTLLALPSSTAHAEERAGIFGGFELALSRADIAPETTDDFPEIGSLVSVHAGYRFGSGLALSGGFSGAAFDFASETMGVDLDNDLAVDLVDISAWFFLPLGDKLDLHLRAGIGRGFASLTTAPADPSQLSNLGGVGQASFGATGSSSEEVKGFGVVASAGLDWRVRGPGLRAFLDLNIRYITTDEDSENLGDDVLIGGVSLGVGWSP